MQLYQRVLKLMGNRFEISIVAEKEAEASSLIDMAVEEIRRIEKLLTTFQEDSITQQINAAAGIHPLEVPQEVFDLIARAQRISELTQGAFDLSYGSLDKKFWNFDTAMKELPEKSLALKSVKLINYKNIILDKENRTVFLKEKGMRIGFGGIGKGYAAERARLLLKKEGVQSGIVNAAGDLTVWGRQPSGKDWTVGIADPSQKENIFSSMQLRDTSIATSGNYEKFVMIAGKRYSHTIDPHTGYPVHGIKSVTVITPNAELADALTTPVMVMGVRAGLHLINQMQVIACIMIDDDDKMYCSDNIKIKQ